ncbi:hypothetical protein J6S88_04055 [bacterium]|nr:hypothetical protein [bacterium]
MDIKKVRATAFAIRNRILGYELLQNKKGVSPYQVNMIKKWSGINEALDRFDFYYAKSHDFSVPKSRTEKTTLLATRYMFWKNKDDKKIVKEKLYMKEGADGTTEVKKVVPILLDEILNRDTSYIRDSRLVAEYDIYVKKSIADSEIDAFYENKRLQEARRTRKSFWTVLRQNMSAAEQK